jgi:hypothetical protein
MAKSRWQITQALNESAADSPKHTTVSRRCHELSRKQIVRKGLFELYLSCYPQDSARGEGNSGDLAWNAFTSTHEDLTSKLSTDRDTR